MNSIVIPIYIILPFQTSDCFRYIDKVVGYSFRIIGKFKIECSCHRSATAV